MIAISTEHLSKYYELGLISTGTVVRDFERWLARARHKPDPYARVGEDTVDNRDHIWALQDISFQVREGEVVGIIGRNGAGKSTLLKILSRITAPTSGEARIKGRVGSLLEVGTGFHPDLTGRENIFMNGAILGMTRAEVRRKLDEIVAFSEVEQFIDTPVKRYSSGMYVRLAFAVAAHLEPEIMIVDEVLAVGDAQFQKKCLDKMETVSHQGRTILFVSHNMGAIRTLCPRAIWIDHGHLRQDGPAPSVIDAYLNSGIASGGRRVWQANERPGNAVFKVSSVTLKNAAGEIATQINLSEPAVFEVEYEIVADKASPQLGVALFDSNANQVFMSLSNTPENDPEEKSLPKGKYRAICTLYGNLLRDGRYYVTIFGNTRYWTEGFRIDQALVFEALEDGVLRRDYLGIWEGAVRPKLAWTTTPL